MLAVIKQEISKKILKKINKKRLVNAIKILVVSCAQNTNLHEKVLNISK